MKKGFTLVEIIISISLIVIIGVGSTIGLIALKNNNKEKTLENMSDVILNAVNVYIETNSDVKKALYESSKELVIPLTTLENSGLVDFDGITLTDDDYVITMLGTETEDADHCAETYIAKSWNIRNGETIYICEKEQEGSTEEEVYGSNLNKVTQQTYYYQGTNVSNYIKLENSDTTYRILYVENDDSIVLYSPVSFGDTFEDKTTMSLTSKRFISINTYSNSHSYKQVTCSAGMAPSIGVVGTFTNNIVSSGETYVDVDDIINTLTCNSVNPVSWMLESTRPTASINDNSTYPDYDCDISYLMPAGSGSNRWYVTCGNSYNKTPEDYKIRLKPCMKIASGVGTSADPYILKNTCS